MTAPAWNPHRLGRPPSIGPTPRQQDALDAIEKLRAELGRAPTRHELRVELGLGSVNGALYLLDALARKGFLVRQTYAARTLVVVGP